MTRHLKHGKFDSDLILTSQHPLVNPERNLSNLLYQKLVQHDEKILFIEGRTREKFSAKNIRELSTRIASGLIGLGLVEQDIVFCVCPDSVSYACTILGIQFAGLVYSGCYSLVPQREIEYQVAIIGAQAILCASQNFSAVCEVADEVDSVRFIICIDDVDVEYTAGLKKVISIKQLIDYVPPAVVDIPAATAKKSDEVISCIMFSSGSSGMPKGVIVTDANAIAQLFSQLNDMDAETVEAGTVGFAHTVGLSMIRVAVFSGTVIVIQDNFQLQNFLQTVEEYGCTSAWLSPSEITLLTKSPLLIEYDISSLREVKVGGATLPVPVVNAFYQKTCNRTKITNIYGMTETGDLTRVPKDVMEVKTVGALLPGHQMKIVDRETGNSMSLGHSGEIYVRGPQLTPGYYKRSDADGENFTADGWFKSGDIGLMDDKGLVYVIGRLKDVIKGDGEQVAPAELESLMLQHDAVAEVAIIGIPDEDHCEVPLAFVVLKETSFNVTKEELLNFVNSQVADYKKIRGGIEFVKSLPKISIGKVDRRALMKRCRSSSCSITV